MGTFTPDRKPLTENPSWENYKSTGISPDRHGYWCAKPIHWPEACDLAFLLMEAAPHLDERSCRVLVDGAINGLPVRLKFRHRANDPIRATENTGIITQMFGPSSFAGGRAGMVHMKFWGSSFPIDIDRIEFATSPDQIFT